MDDIRKKRWYSIAFLICIMLLCASMPFHLIFKNELVVYILNITLRIGFVIYYFYYIKKEQLSKLDVQKINKKCLLFIPFLLICISNFIVVLYNRTSINENISFIKILQDFLLCILIAISEEIVFRGVLFKEFLNSKKPILAIIYSSLIFGSIHLLNINSLNSIGYCVIQSIYSFGIGLGLSLLYYYSKNIILPIILHFSFNFFNDSLVTNLYDLPWNESFFIINILLAIVIIIYGILVYLKFIKEEK